MRRVTSAIAIVAISIVTATPLAYAGYPPGTFPGSAPGGAFRTVVMSRMVCRNGGSLQASYDRSALIVQIPAGAFGACVQVSIYAAETAVIAPLLPTGSLLLDSFGVGWSGPEAAKPLTLTINDSTIASDARVFETTTSGVALLTDVRVGDGAVTVSFTSPPGYVVTRTAAAPSATSGETAAVVTAPPSALPGSDERGIPMFILPLAVIIGIAAVLLALARARRSRIVR
jgi:hypothetical protein